MKVKVNIKASSVYQLTVGDIRKVKTVNGIYDLTRGSLFGSGTFDLTASGVGTPKYSHKSFGDDTGITITALKSGNKLVMKIVTGSADANVSVFNFEYEQKGY